VKFPKPTKVRNKAYVNWIRSLPCLITRSERGVDPHHCPKKGHGSTSSKTDDTRCIPLRHDLHVELHQTGKETFSRKYELDYEDVVSRLNKIWEEMNE